MFTFKNTKLTINANISAKTTASHIPSIPIIKGSSNIIKIPNTNVLKKDIIPETTPLFSAVKKDDANILNPLIRYANENNLIALVVISSNSIS